MVCDVTGRVVKEAESCGSVQLDLGSLPAGVYFVRNGGKSVKIIKQ
jgi:hypothetical protein